MENKGVVLITGSNGFIGSAVARRLAKNYQVVGLDFGDVKEKIPGVEHVFLDIASSEKVAAVLDEIRGRYGSKICSVVHLAAYYSFSGEESSKYREITVEGTRSLLRELNERFNLEQFIFSSTMLVHAPTELGTEINESSPVAPSWPYPESKVEAERVIQAERLDAPVVILRIAGVYQDDCHSIPIAQHITRIHERQLSSMLFPGKMKHGQAFLHLEDLIDAISLLVEKRAEIPSQTTLLLGEDKPVSYQTLQNRIGELLHGHLADAFTLIFLDPLVRNLFQ